MNDRFSLVLCPAEGQNSSKLEYSMKDRTAGVVQASVRVKVLQLTNANDRRVEFLLTVKNIQDPARISSRIGGHTDLHRWLLRKAKAIKCIAANWSWAVHLCHLAVTTFCSMCLPLEPSTRSLLPIYYLWVEFISNVVTRDYAIRHQATRKSRTANWSVMRGKSGSIPTRAQCSRMSSGVDMARAGWASWRSRFNQRESCCPAHVFPILTHSLKFSDRRRSPQHEPRGSVVDSRTTVPARLPCDIDDSMSAPEWKGLTNYQCLTCHLCLEPQLKSASIIPSTVCTVTARRHLNAKNGENIPLIPASGWHGCNSSELCSKTSAYFCNVSDSFQGRGYYMCAIDGIRANSKNLGL